MYTLIKQITASLNRFIDAPLSLHVGRDSIINHNNDLGDDAVGKTYVALIQPSRVNVIFKEGYVRNQCTIRIFIGALYKSTETEVNTNEFNDSGENEYKSIETEVNTNEFNDSGENELKILDETLLLCNEFVYKLKNNDRVKEITRASISEAFDVKDTNHTGHYIDLTFEFLENLCFGQKKPTPKPKPEPEIPEPEPEIPEPEPEIPELL